MNEEWRDIKGFEGRYQISSLGNLKSLDRNFNNREIKGVSLKPAISSNGYLRTTFCIGRNFRKSFSVHRLVADAFIPNKDSKILQVNHKNGNKLDNSVENLEWCTARENIHHAVDLGLFDGLSGESSHLSVYKEEDILKVINYLKLGISPSEVARKVKISRSSISKINLGKAWLSYSKSQGITKFPINGKVCLR